MPNPYVDPIALLDEIILRLEHLSGSLEFTERNLVDIDEDISDLTYSVERCERRVADVEDALEHLLGEVEE